ncbi:Ankyrin repeat-containing protein [Cynara cardunculus var. scolymus]|uniref:Ankyrin repeat-containing protein n=1 Tax=Cynara cardunculus var. scolymus TaxID=59895 RepID=A0A103XZR1_CYNCS|nr:Ankyrin repeat-containing protein [Cynara cardunculus var. scolymus]
MGESDAMIQQHPPHELESELAQPPDPELAQELASTLAQVLEPVLLAQELESSKAPSSSQAPEPTLEPVLAQELESTLEQAPEPALTQEPEMVPVVPQAPETAQAPEPAQINLPCQDLLNDGRRREFVDTCVPLYEASITGDWKTANEILQNRRYQLVRYSITEHCDTALHVAASASNTESTKFVENLVKMMRMEDLQLQNKGGNTPLCLAAAAGNVDIATIMVDMNQELLKIPNCSRQTPLYIAVLFRNKAMVNYLYDKSPEMDALNTALKIFGRHPDIPKRENALGLLAKKPCAFNEIKPHIVWRIVITCNKVGPVAKESKAMQLLKEIWASIEEKPKSEIDGILRGPPTVKDRKRTYPSRVLFVAAEFGNTEFVVELIRKYPDLIWKQNDDGQSIFHIAVSHRRESIYNLLYEIGSTKAFITCLKDRKGNNMLHLVGKKVEKNQPPDVSGVAFQLQRELLWYKEVESMIPPHYKDQKNDDDQTPHELFTKTHKDLVSEAEKWMKGTASKCMVVAALIATIVFGVAFTIPGGYNENNGFPLFLHEGPFIVFVVLDAISLISSATSILMFLSILTSRYAQKDFIESLPKKLMVGLATLFFSIMTMMIAFSVSFFVLYRHRFIPIAIVISVLSLIPIIAYAKLQYPLLVDVFRSTFGSRYLFKPKERILYYQNPRV